MDNSNRILSETMRIMAAMAAGDVSQAIEGEYRGSFDQLKQDVNAMAAKLQDVIGEIKISVASIRTSASEIAEDNADLSRRTEHQAASLEETAVSMEEMTSTVKQNAENARNARELTVTSRKQAERGAMSRTGPWRECGK